jgi:nitronate monooxygenase
MSLPPDKLAILQTQYPWTQTPLIVAAPMRLISGPALALAVSRAGGIGFLGAGTGSDLSRLSKLLQDTSSLVSASPISGTPDGILPVGVGFIIWGADLQLSVQELRNLKLKPAAVWLFAQRSTDDLVKWAKEIRAATENRSKIWVQVATVSSAVEVVRACIPDVLVVQGSDAGGHGLARSSSIISLLPEVSDALVDVGYSIPLVAAGGIMDGRGVAAALMLRASGACLGTRFLATPEAEISQGYKMAVIEGTDGGVNTVRTKLYDSLRGTTGWPDDYDGRGLINKTYRDFESGMGNEENSRLYEEALKLGDKGWGKDTGRITTYAGTGVGLAKDIMPAGQVVKDILIEVRSELASRRDFL